MKQYHIITFGCQANLADSERIASRLQKMGYQKADSSAEALAKANLIVINACSVRQSAINRVYGRIKELSARGGSALGRKIIMAGCILEKDKKKLSTKYQNIEFWHPDEYFDLIPISSNLKTAYIPIMTGCNNFCTYCAVPYTRGRERSRKTKDIVKDTKNAVKNGAKEIWLLGQNVNSYHDSGKNSSAKALASADNIIDFPKLLKTVNKIPGDFWIHFISSHPKDFSNSLIKTIAECEKISRKIHLPVQSGDNTILKKMNRKYTVGHYKKLIKKIRRQIPNAEISTDVIVGFPGETKKQFQNTVKLFKEINFSKAYVAKYSPRPGTLAQKKFKDNITIEEKKRRWKILNEITNKK